MTDAFLSILEISASVSLVVLVLLLLGPFVNKRYASKWKCWIWLFLALRLLFPVSDLRLISDTFSDMFLRSAKAVRHDCFNSCSGICGRLFCIRPDRSEAGRRSVFQDVRAVED